MLKRSDLSKQFELIVQQEIKNFQNTTYQINQTLNELRDKIENLEKTTSANQALLDSRHKSLEIELQILRNSHEKSTKKCDIHSNDINSFIKKIEDKLEVTYQNALDANRKNEHARNVIQELHAVIEVLEDELKGHSLTISNSLDQMQFNVSKNMSNFKKEILELPSETESLRREFDEKITTHKIDVEGIMKEIRINRREFTVIEKKLEHIYTLIERLKKSEVNP